MKQHTLIENIKPDSHSYLVTIGTDLGEFTGATVCREEDWAHESDIFGWTLAETKAEIEYAKAKKAFYSAQLKALTEFWRNMITTRTYNVDDFWVKKMRIKVDEVKARYDEWSARIQYLKRSYHNTIITRDLGFKNATLQRALKDKTN